jgi:hypothetical protein
MQHARRVAALATAAIVLTSCGGEVSVAPQVQLAPPAVAVRDMFDDDGDYWEEMPEEYQGLGCLWRSGLTARGRGALLPISVS